MSQPKNNFIITMDESTAMKFVEAGFKLVAKSGGSGGSYVFLNQPPKNFKFEKFDKTKFSYTNMLSI